MQFIILPLESPFLTKLKILMRERHREDYDDCIDVSDNGNDDIDNYDDAHQ